MSNNADEGDEGDEENVEMHEMEMEKELCPPEGGCTAKSTACRPKEEKIPTPPLPQEAVPPGSNLPTAPQSDPDIPVDPDKPVDPEKLPSEVTPEKTEVPKERSGNKMARDIDISKPKYDQSTYAGRAKYFFTTTNPLNLFNSQETLEKAKSVVESVRAKRWSEVESLSDDEIWRAKELYDSAYHPDTGELMNPIGRMSAQVPMNMAITGCMMNFYKSTPAVIFWQWVNQSFNALVNYTNRSGDAAMSNEQIATSYVMATGGALATALTLNRMTKKMSPLIGRIVPFAAVAAANCINIPMMRLQELRLGIPVTDAAGVRLGDSTWAAVYAIAATSFSRNGMCAPGMVITPIIMNKLEQRGTFCRRPWLSTPLSVIICGVCLTFATPMCCALFEQRASLPTSSLEAGLREEVQKKGVETVYFNKGL